MSSKTRIVGTLLAGAVMALGLAGTANADEKKKSVYEQVVGDIKGGKLNVEGDHAAVVNLVIKRNIPITYEYIAQLVRTPNAFGAGPACIICHHSNDAAISYRGLDLSTCEGILKGATEAPARPILVAGTPGKSLIRRMIRNNRMPLGVSFAAPTDTPAITAVKDWINAGAKDDKAFKKIQESFAKAGAYGTEQACVDCHMSNEEPPSFHELDLTSYKGIMLGADSILNAKTGKPPTKIVVPGKAEESALYQRLVENRMPPGIDPSIDRDTPATRILLRWIDQGAKCQ